MKISIIIPVYNSEEYIGRCLDSILNQSFSDFEVICLNDGSSDNSLSLLKEYELKDDRIKVYSHSNMGIARTRNKGIELAKGKYIMFIDNDDFIDSNYLQTYYDTIENEKVDIVLGGYRRITEKNKILEIRCSKDTKWGKFIIVAPWAKIYKKDLIDKCNIKFLDYGIGEDIYFYIQYIDNSLKVKAIDYIGYNWFYNTESVSNTKHKGLNDNLDILYLINKIKEKINNKNIEKDIIDYFYVRLILYYLLYSGRYSSKEKFIKEYKYLIDYLKDNIPNYNYILRKRIPKDEDRRVKFILKFFGIIDKFNFINIFSSFYCKGDK